MDDVWTKNLKALTSRNPDVAIGLQKVAANPHLTWAQAKQEDAQVASLVDATGRRRALCSAYRPLTEAKKLADSINLENKAMVVQIGFGVGHQVRAILDRLKGRHGVHAREESRGLLVVFEPDPTLMHAVMRQVELTDLLASPSFELVVGPVVDSASMIRRMEPVAALIVQGVQFVNHPSAKHFDAETLSAFHEAFQRVISFCRANLTTALINSTQTCWNLTQNLGRYAAGETIDALIDVAKGRPAVVVSAGPSLARNASLLAEPGVRDRVVIIAAQTVLKPLLDRGVRPHFVTALDWSQISARFYENLPPLPDVTLVAEAKSHPSILDGYPGPIRVLQNGFLDQLLGDAARPIKPMPAGSTVAHLSFYLAQHLGCDPIMLIGQDLAFSEGLYYCPGTAIHQVWEPELNAFNSLEMMELKRILRHKSQLHEKIDCHGQPCYSDEQMLTYLAQFERDFSTASQTILDATEGGLAKQHTTSITLRQALDERALEALPDMPSAEGGLSPTRLREAIAKVRRSVDQIRRLRRNSLKSIPVLKRMIQDQRHEAKMDRHFEELQKQRDEVEDNVEAMRIVDAVGQLIAFKRVRADRKILVSDETDPYERQIMQLERDIENVEWIAEACREALDMFDQALGRLRDQEKSAVSGSVS